MQKTSKNEIFTKFISWVFRRNPPELIIFKSTLCALVGIFGVDLIGGFFISSDQLQITAILNPGKLIPPSVLYPIFIILATALIGSLFIAWLKFQDNRRKESRKKVIVVEGRGLRDDNGKALVDAIPGSILGHRQSYLLDLRQQIDGKVLKPEDALWKIKAMKIATQQLKCGSDSNDVTMVYGGLTSVPFTFLTGIELDDEGLVETFDWDRNQEEWRQLDEIDDNKRFEIEGLNTIENQEDIVLAVAVSYPVNDSDLLSTFNWPIVRMSLRQISSNSHWSIDKQIALADQFLETIKKLSSVRVKRIHLVLAAPNSVVFLLGRRFDKRNLPRVIVYQYERENLPAYPWGVEMPVSGKEEAKIINLELSESICRH